jgi:hypothetical protein
VHGVLDERTRNDDADVLAVRGDGLRVVALLGRVEGGPRVGRVSPLLERLRGLAVVRKLLVLVVIVELVVVGQQRRLEGLVPADADVRVALLVENHDVARVHGAVALRGDLRRRHHVELADLRVAREHLQALVVVADLEGLRRLHAQAKGRHGQTSAE